VAAAAASRRKKSSQKSTRPRGAKDAVTFPGAIGRNNACVRADSQQVALGGRKRLPRVGECIVADGRRPCQRQPLRGLKPPFQGLDPSHVVHCLRGESLIPFNSADCQNAAVKLPVSKFTTTCLLLGRSCAWASVPGAHVPSSWCGKIRQAATTGQGEFLSESKTSVTATVAVRLIRCCINRLAMLRCERMQRMRVAWTTTQAAAQQKQCGG
jgi:hypothetical protein